MLLGALLVTLCLVVLSNRFLRLLIFVFGHNFVVLGGCGGVALLRRSLRSFRLFVGHRAVLQLFPFAVEELTQGADCLDIVDLLVISGAELAHILEEDQAHLLAIFGGLALAALLHEFLDDRVVRELCEDNLPLVKAKESVVYSEGLGLPVSFGESFGTVGGLGGLGDGGIHGVPLSLA